MRYVLITALALVAGASAGAQSTDPQALLRQAVAAQQSGDVRTAIRLYREILKAHPEATQIHSNLGAALVRDGQVDEAIAEYRIAIERMPNEPRVRLNLALAYYKVGRPERGRAGVGAGQPSAAQRIAAGAAAGRLLFADGSGGKDLQSAAPLERVHRDEKGLIYALSIAMVRTKRTEQAKILLDRILREGESAEAELLLGQGERLNQNNMAAAEHLARAVKLNPNLPGVHSLYGQVLHATEQYEAAAVQFREELKINPYDYDANMDRMVQLKQEGKTR